MTVCIIDYGSGNIRSVAKAFEHAGGKVLVTSNVKELAYASHIVLPGVGAYGDCMRGLSQVPGMLDMLSECVIEKQKNFFGICVGMQMMFERGLEHGEHQGLGWLNGEVVKLTPSDTSLKIPHMGWNELIIKKPHPLLEEVTGHAYFVHSYHAKAAPEDIVATVDYGGELVAAVAKANMMGTQFHPEKSQSAGLAIIKNFLSM